MIIEYKFEVVSLLMVICVASHIWKAEEKLPNQFVSCVRIKNMSKLIIKVRQYGYFGFV